MKPVLLPLAQRLGRMALRRRGVESRWVSTPQGRVHAYDAAGQGDLPTTAILHGIGSMATAFGPVLTHLRRHVRRVVAPEFPGHGFSAAARTELNPDALFQSVSTALDWLLDEPSIVVGNSLGGAMAMKYAMTRPARVKALVLVSPAGARASDEDWTALKGAFDMTTRDDAKAFLARLYHRPPWFLPLLAGEFRASIGRREVKDLLATATNDDALSPESLKALPMPILLLWGKSEHLLPDAFLEYFTAHLPGHTVIERPDGFGHCPHFDAPSVLADRIAAFARTGR